MKIIKDEAATPKRKRRITLEFDPDEAITSIRNGAYYRLGGQVRNNYQDHNIASLCDAIRARSKA